VSEFPAPENRAPNSVSGIRQGLAWIAEGRRLVRQDGSLWLGMTVVYFLLGFLLKLIPFMGDLILTLMTPMLLAGVVWGAAYENHAGRNQAPLSEPALFQTWIARPARELLRIFTREDKVFGAVLLGIVTLGLDMLVKIAGYLLVGGSMLTGLMETQAGTPPFTAMLGMLTVAILYLILAMGLFYSVPLTVLGNRQPLAAIAESFSVCRRYPVPMLTLSLPFFLVYLVIMMVFARNHWLGDLLVISAGLVTLPVFIASAYRSYLTLYPLVDTPPPLSP
jgi:hypothetical protein